METRKLWSLTPIIIYLQVNKFSPMGDVIGSGMGELSI